jgi:hypothetical protein
MTSDYARYLSDQLHGDESYAEELHYGKPKRDPYRAALACELRELDRIIAEAKGAA